MDACRPRGVLGWAGCHIRLSAARDPDERDELGEEQRIPLFNVKQGNVGVLFGFPIAGLLLGSLISHALVLPLILVGVTLGVATTYAAPPHLTAWTWLRDATHHYLFRARMTLSQPADAAHDSTEGGLVQYTSSPRANERRT